MDPKLASRIATLVRLVEGAPDRRLGRTALMKLAYFLHALRDVPIGYEFSLYSYGPFDSTVLEDLDYAARLGALSVSTETYSSGYGYAIRPGPQASWAAEAAGPFIGKYDEAIAWVTHEFGAFGSADLELLSTIVYVDRRLAATVQAVTIGHLAQQVNEIKPHFTRAKVLERIDLLREKRLLRSVTG